MITVNTRAIACLLMLAIAFGLCAPAAANPLLLAPTATTLTSGQVRAEAAFSPDNTNGRYYWLTTGLKQFEIDAIRLERHSLASENMVGLQFSFLPETSLSPGVAFGVSDIASQSNGIAPYAVITRHLPMGEAAFLIKDFAATAGVGLFGIRGPFSGFEAKLPMNVFVQGEYDSHDFNAAVGWQPTTLFRVKAYTIRKEYYLGAELVPVTF